jgi:hypothetical protein
MLRIVIPIRTATRPIAPSARCAITVDLASVGPSKSCPCSDAYRRPSALPSRFLVAIKVAPAEATTTATDNTMAVASQTATTVGRFAFHVCHQTCLNSPIANILRPMARPVAPTTAVQNGVAPLRAICSPSFPFTARWVSAFNFATATR